MLLALLLAVVSTASPAPTTVQVVVHNSWSAAVYAYELDAPTSCLQWAFGGAHPYNKIVAVGKNIEAQAAGSCSASPKFYIGIPGFLDFDCWFTLGPNTLTDGPYTGCFMTKAKDTNTYSIFYQQKGTPAPL